MMKKLLPILLLLSPIFAWSQTITVRTAPIVPTTSAPNYNKGGVSDAHLVVPLTLIIPVFTTPTFNNATPVNGAIGVSTSDSSFYFYYHNAWRKAGGGGGNTDSISFTNKFINRASSGIPIIDLNTDTIRGGNMVVLSANGALGHDTTQYLPNSIISGLGLSISGSNVIIQPGVWRIHDLLYSASGTTTLAIDAQDPTLSRYDALYATTSNTIGLVSGMLSASPVVPSIPAGSISVGNVLITPTSVTVIPTPITNYVTTSTSQTNIQADKSWVGHHVITSPDVNTTLTLNQSNSGFNALQVNGTTIMNGQSVVTGFTEYESNVNYEQDLFFGAPSTSNNHGLIWNINNSETNLYYLRFSTTDSLLHYYSTYTGNSPSHGNALVRFSDLTGGGGTVTSVTSATGAATVANTTTTPVITIVSAPKWTTPRLLAGNSVDGSANVAFTNKFIVQGTTDAGLTNAQFLGALGTGLVKNTTTTGVLSIAAAGTDYQAPISLTTTGTTGAATFSGNVLNIPQYAGTTYLAGTGLTLTGSTFSVNTSQSISTLSNLTSNGLIKTSGGIGTLGIATAGTDYQAPISLTTTGTGAATFVSNVLNIPTPTSSGGTVTSVGLTVSNGVLIGGTASPITTSGTYTLQLDSSAYTTRGLLSTYLTKAQIVATYAPLASPALTGTPTVPTATAGTNTTQVASTAFVTTATGAYLPLTGGTLTGPLTINTATSPEFTITNGAGSSTFAQATGGNLTVTPGSTLIDAGAFTVTGNFASTSVSSNLMVPSGTGTGHFTASQFLYGGGSGNSLRTALYGSTSSTLTANDNYSALLVASAPITAAATGTHTWLANAVINPIGTITNGSAIPITNSATLYLGGAGSGATNNFTLYSASGLNQFQGAANLNGITTISPSVTGTTNPFVISPTQTASANNQVQAALTVNQTIADGANTGVIHEGFNVNFGSSSHFVASDINGGGEVDLTSSATPTTTNYNARLTSTNTIFNAPNAAGAVQFRINNTTGFNMTNSGGQFTYTFSSVPTKETSGNTFSVLSQDAATGNISTINAPVVLATVTGINAKSTGTTALYTVPAGKTCVVTGVYVRVTAATAITVGLSADVGVTAADVYANTAMTTLTTSGKVFQYPTGGVYSSSAAAAVINFNINTAATGTSQTVAVDIIGYLE